MKHIIKICALVASLCITGNVMAQRAYKGQTYLTVNGGMTTTSGYYGALDVDFNIGKRVTLGTGIYFINNYPKLNERSVSDKQCYVGLHCSYPINYNKVSAAVKAGILLGAEIPQKKVAEGLVVTNNAKFSYGLEIAIPVEFAVAPKFSLIADIRSAYVINSYISKFIFTPGIGARFYF